MKPNAPLVTPGYWCECWTQSPATGEVPALLASLDAPNAVTSIRWIRIAVRTIASALDRNAFANAWEWLSGGYVADLEALASGEQCAFTIHHRSTRITWTARPVIFLTLANRQAAQLPPCASQFTPRPTLAPRSLRSR
ncbi:hypothetical protein K7472_09135 [Streptomyces sp. PTM05]|uniref:Uncharacterized protein n=1 Tax=Streptantibioticus parmotrematis TaxID=2873249 RepID=A0ABS7QP91_9ACTN|nr:hypothetical protein [Streptantibioticus parmotrematis]MBY8885007.1 hypothetical protein [Streptantibioticus parmotrematis]